MKGQPEEMHRSPVGFLRQPWLWLGIAMIFFQVGLCLLSFRYGYAKLLSEEPIVPFVCLLMLSGFVYLSLLSLMDGTPSGRWGPAWIIGVGIILRLITFFSTPILATDYYRYLWDGAVTTSGINPYAYSPKQALEAAHGGNDLPADLVALAKDGKEILSRINHPHLKTIYPPVAQGAFAIAHRLRPWSITTWRMVLLIIDIAVLVSLHFLLRSMNMPTLYLALYWWNPILLKEIYNSGHMDLIPVLFVLLALLFTIRDKRFLSMLLLSLAVGGKVWPVVLLPILLRPSAKDPKGLCAALLLFAVAVSLLFVPVYAGGLGDDAGFTAYSKEWEMNDAFYMLLLRTVQGIGLGDGDFTAEHLWARSITIVLLALIILHLSRPKVESPQDLCTRCLWAVAFLFLLSPAQFPWYFLWFLPFLALRPRLSLLLLTALLPIHYLRFRLKTYTGPDVFGLEGVGIYDNLIVWFEYVPVWALLLWEQLRWGRVSPKTPEGDRCDTALQ